MSATASPPTQLNPPSPTSPRFTLELEFVLCLSNPYYLQYLAINFPHLLNPPRASGRTSSARDAATDNSESVRFARYLTYLYDYWRTPKYSQYLTHPGAVLRNLALLQEESFRKDLIRPDVITRLLETTGVGRVAEEDARERNEAVTEAVDRSGDAELAGDTGDTGDKMDLAP